MGSTDKNVSRADEVGNGWRGNRGRRDERRTSVVSGIGR